MSSRSGGQKPFKPKTERIDVSFRILGARQEFHPIAVKISGADFRPSIEAAQFAGYIVDGNRRKQWSLVPSTDVQAVFSDIAGRLESEAFPKAFAILDRRKLLDALRSFDLTIADNVIPFDQVIMALEAKLND